MSVTLLKGPSSCRALQHGRTRCCAPLFRPQSSEVRARKTSQELQRDFILSILQANPSARDSRFYLKAFAPSADALNPKRPKDSANVAQELVTQSSSESRDSPSTSTKQQTNSVAESLVEQPLHQHTSIVKIQGPFTDRQLDSVAQGLVYLGRLGLVSIIVVDLDGWAPDQPDAQLRMRKEVHRVSDAIVLADGGARPLFEPVIQKKQVAQKQDQWTLDSERSLRAALESGDMPVLPPYALGDHSQTFYVTANDYIRGLTSALARSGEETTNQDSRMSLTPLRLMVINREGGIPSHARGGTPHLSINLESEFDHINETFIWQDSHPTALPTLQALRDCLEVLPRTSSAVVVSHRSPKALIGNLVTNKPAHSPSLHLSALPSPSQLQSTPTIIRYGLPIRVIRSLQDVNLSSLTHLLQTSFRRELDVEAYYGRLGERLDFMVIAGDCAACAIVTREGRNRDLVYLDKFAILPELQGDGTVDFLWGALRDESFGLGLLDALNNNGGLEGKGEPVDLIWRSRANNPVNKWYFERSSGFAKLAEMGKGGTPGMLFWCDAEKRVQEQEALHLGKPVPFVAEEEQGRLESWCDVIGAIPRFVSAFTHAHTFKIC